VTMRLAPLVLLAVLAAPASAGPIQGGYSTRPLEKAVIEPAEVLLDSIAFNDWLNANYAKLDAESMPGPREHLYYLIDSQVKSIYARDHVVRPVIKNDPTLELLFSWSDRLHVYGGGLVKAALKPNALPDAPTVTHVPDGFGLSLRDDMLVLDSKTGQWSVSVPYYFMIWEIGEAVPTDGPKTQVVALSTGAARHVGQEGYSQATVMILFGPGGDEASFTHYWAKQLGFTGDELEESLDVRSLKSHRRYDETRNMRHEYVTWSAPKGQFVVAYSGINGTYQWNRPNFLDLLRSIQEK
jgi:hypothetical protein